MVTVKTIDAHVAGQPLRLVVHGFPSPPGRSMADKRDWVTKHADRLRRSVMLEPRGHRDISGAVLTEPTSPGSHAGVLFMHADGYRPMSGHGVIGVTTIALQAGLLDPGSGAAAIVFDTQAGTVKARAQRDPVDRRVSKVSFSNVPSFVLQGGIDVAVGARRVRVDVAFGGVFYAIVDGEATGLPLDGAHLPELRRAGQAIREAVEAKVVVEHPLDPRLKGLSGTLFTGPAASPSADLRTVAIGGGMSVGRSPGGTATAALLAVLDEMGLLGGERPFVQESLLGTTFAGRIVGRTSIGEQPAVIPEIEGSAWITGEHTFSMDERDPFREGFELERKA